MKHVREHIGNFFSETMRAMDDNERRCAVAGDVDGVRRIRHARAKILEIRDDLRTKNGGN